MAEDRTRQIVNRSQADRQTDNQVNWNLTRNCLYVCSRAGISKQPNAPLSLQDLIEKVMVLTQAVERERRQAPSTTSGILSQKLQ
jgi:hypothetical protein